MLTPTQYQCCSREHFRMARVERSAIEMDKYNTIQSGDLMLSISSSFSLSRLSRSALSWAIVALAESRRLCASLRASVTSANSVASASFSVSSWIRLACSSWSRWFNSLICPRASLRASETPRSQNTLVNKSSNLIEQPIVAF